MNYYFSLIGDLVKQHSDPHFRVIRDPTMRITFDPPLGQLTRVAIPLPRSSLTSSVTLTFTAQVATEEYNALLNDGGRVQLWTDLPFNGVSDGSWQEAQFIRPVSVSSNSCDISMGDDKPGDGDVLISVGIDLIPNIAIDSIFQFTYRVKYEGGKVHWFGKFGINGSLVLKRIESVQGFTFFEGWREVEQGLWALQIPTECVGKTSARLDASRYRVWSLGKDSLLYEPNAAVVLFMIPRSQSSLVSTPAYILSASCGLTITLLADGSITVSGPGTIYLTIQMPDRNSNLNQELTECFERSGLHNWRVLASDSQNGSVVIVATSSADLVQSLVLPLWTSAWQRRSVCIPYSTITGTLGQARRDIAIFSYYKLQVWVLGEEGCMPDCVSLAYTPTGSAFAIAPLHPLTNPNSGQSSRMWATCIFTKHRALSLPEDMHILPVAPQVSRKRVPEVAPPTTPQKQVQSQYIFQRIARQLKDSILGSPPSTQSYRSSLLSWNTNRIPQGILGLCKSIFASFGIFLRVFCPLFGGRSKKLPTAPSRSPKSTPQLDQYGESSLVNTSKGITAPPGCTSNGNGIAPTADTVARYGHGQYTAPVNGRKFVAELQYDEGDLHQNKRTITVALIPLSPTIKHQVIHENGIERSVAFVDGLDPNCTVSKCSVSFMGRQAGYQPTVLKGPCSLLEYEVDWTDSDCKRVIEVLSPPVSV